MSETGFVSSKCHNYSVNALVLENQPPGTSVLRVRAHDADTGVNGEVKYGIMQRDGASPGFTINHDTGAYFLLYQIVNYTQLNQRAVMLIGWFTNSCCLLALNLLSNQ